MYLFSHTPTGGGGDDEGVGLRVAEQDHFIEMKDAPKTRLAPSNGGITSPVEPSVKSDTDIPETPPPLFSEWVALGGSPKRASSATEPSISKSREPGYQSLTQSRKKPLVGLVNQGQDSCFLNCTVQCLSNIIELRDYLLLGTYDALNVDGSSGKQRLVAEAFRRVMKALWDPSTPRPFDPQQLLVWARRKLGSGQQDAEECLGFLLDALHDELNRIETSSEIRQPDWKPGGGPKELAEMAAERWELEKQHNDSVIMDLFQGLEQRTVTCGQCHTVGSVTMTPFKRLNLSFPTSTVRKLKLSFISSNPDEPPLRLILEIGMDASFHDIKQKLGALKRVVPEHLVGFCCRNGQPYRWFHDADQNEEAKDGDELIFHDLGVPVTSSSNVVGTKIGPEGSVTIPVYTCKATEPVDPSNTDRPIECCLQPFFITLSQTEATDPIAVREAISRGYGRFIKREMNSDLRVPQGDSQAPSRPLAEHPGEEPGTETHLAGEQTRNVGSSPQSQVPDRVGVEAFAVPTSVRKPTPRHDRFKVYIAKASSADPAGGPNEVGSTDGVVSFWNGIVNPTTAIWSILDSSVHMPDASNDRVSQPAKPAPFPAVRLGDGVFVEWTAEGVNDFFNTAPHKETNAVNSAIRKKRTPREEGKAISIDDCLDEFFEEEDLEDWSCPACGKVWAATKQLKIYQAPDILVIHFKRFLNYGEVSKKIDHMVDFPIDGLNLEDRIVERKVSKALELSEDGTKRCEMVYDLFAVANQFGNMEGGHYTAFCRNWEDGLWYEYNDSKASQISLEKVKSPAAYMLFYCRRAERPILDIPWIKAEALEPLASAHKILQQANQAIAAFRDRGLEKIDETTTKSMAKIALTIRYADVLLQQETAYKAKNLARASFMEMELKGLRGQLEELPSLRQTVADVFSAGTAAEFEGKLAAVKDDFAGALCAGLYRALCRAQNDIVKVRPNSIDARGMDGFKRAAMTLMVNELAVVDGILKGLKQITSGAGEDPTPADLARARYHNNHAIDKYRRAVDREAAPLILSMPDIKGQIESLKENCSAARQGVQTALESAINAATLFDELPLTQASSLRDFADRLGVLQQQSDKLRRDETGVTFARGKVQEFDIAAASAMGAATGNGVQPDVARISQLAVQASIEARKAAATSIDLTDQRKPNAVELARTAERQVAKARKDAKTVVEKNKVVQEREALRNLVNYVCLEPSATAAITIIDAAKTCLDRISELLGKLTASQEFNLLELEPQRAAILEWISLARIAVTMEVPEVTTVLQKQVVSDVVERLNQQSRPRNADEALQGYRDIADLTRDLLGVADGHYFGLATTALDAGDCPEDCRAIYWATLNDVLRLDTNGATRNAVSGRLADLHAELWAAVCVGTALIAAPGDTVTKDSAARDLFRRIDAASFVQRSAAYVVSVAEAVREAGNDESAESLVNTITSAAKEAAVRVRDLTTCFAKPAKSGPGFAYIQGTLWAVFDRLQKAAHNKDATKDTFASLHVALEVRLSEDLALLQRLTGYLDADVPKTREQFTTYLSHHWPPEVDAEATEIAVAQMHGVVEFAAALSSRALALGQSGSVNVNDPVRSEDVVPRAWLRVAVTVATHALNMKAIAEDCFQVAKATELPKYALHLKEAVGATARGAYRLVDAAREGLDGLIEEVGIHLIAASVELAGADKEMKEAAKERPLVLDIRFFATLGKIEAYMNEVRLALSRDIESLRDTVNLRRENNGSDAARFDALIQLMTVRRELGNTIQTLTALDLRPRVSKCHVQATKGKQYETLGFHWWQHITVTRQVLEGGQKSPTFDHLRNSFKTPWFIRPLPFRDTENTARFQLRELALVESSKKGRVVLSKEDRVVLSKQDWFEPLALRVLGNNSCQVTYYVPDGPHRSDTGTRLQHLGRKLKPWGPYNEWRRYWTNMKAWGHVKINGLTATMLLQKLNANEHEMLHCFAFSSLRISEDFRFKGIIKLLGKPMTRRLILETFRRIDNVPDAREGYVRRLQAAAANVLVGVLRSQVRGGLLASTGNSIDLKIREMSDLLTDIEGIETRPDLHARRQGIMYGALLAFGMDVQREQKKWTERMGRSGKALVSASAAAAAAAAQVAGGPGGAAAGEAIKEITTLVENEIARWAADRQDVARAYMTEVREAFIDSLPKSDGLIPDLYVHLSAKQVEDYVKLASDVFAQVTRNTVASLDNPGTAGADGKDDGAESSSRRAGDLHGG